MIVLDRIRRRPVLTAALAILVLLIVLSFVLPFVGGGHGGVTTSP